MQNSMQLLLLLILLMRPALGADFQCRDTKGDPLDWFVMLKQPNSYEYAYISAKSPDAWIQPSESNLSTSGPLVATLSPIFSNMRSQGVDALAAYNDEPPPSPHLRAESRWDSIHGHMKGVVVLTAGQRGFWLIHSVPKFPNLRMPKYTYPHTGLKYGQSFLCITVNSSDMAESIGKQLLTSHPDLYNISVSQTARAKWPSWADLGKKTLPLAKVLNSTANLVTSGGLPVLHVAKSSNLTRDLYDYLLAKQLHSNIQVETWQHGGERLNSTCSRSYNVTKVLQVRIGDKKKFSSTADHSKWCVATSGKPYVCVGDMNRAKSQFKRGGGIACMALAGPHSLFRKVVLRDQPCGNRTGMHYIDDASDDDAKLLAMFDWVMIAAICAIACTLISVLLLLLIAIGRVRANSRYQSL